MTFEDWVEESEQRFAQYPASTAAKNSVQELVRGGIRRTFDQWIGKTWWERDWDVLVILDAMRVDLAQEVIDEDIDSVWSPASTSIDWIERHFADEHETHWRGAGYVTGNPFADHETPNTRSANLTDKPIEYLDLVFERGFREVDGIKTTPPEDITDAAIHAWRHEDIDRLIVHYMQPHQPFRSKPEWESVFSNLENLAGEVNQGGPCVWERCREGEIPKDELWDAYAGNLEWVWEDVQKRLLRNIDANVIVTADHGNGMGEWGTWAHPPGSISPTIRKVPMWRKRGVDEQTVKPETIKRETDPGIDEQLRALGYK